MFQNRDKRPIDRRYEELNSTSAAKTDETFLLELTKFCQTEARRLVGPLNAQKVDEFSVDAIGHLFQKLDRFQGESLFSTWATSCVRNLYLNYNRIEDMRPIPASQLGDEGVFDLCSLPERALAVDRRNPWADPETVKQFSDAIKAAQLNLGQREAISLRSAGHTHEQIATVCGVKVGTVKSRLFDAKKKILAKMREELSKEDFEELFGSLKDVPHRKYPQKVA